jgi:hypothetical protein
MVPISFIITRNKKSILALVSLGVGFGLGRGYQECESSFNDSFKNPNKLVYADVRLVENE